MGHGVEERRPWTNEETGALGEHLSARNEQLRLWRKEDINWEVFHGQGDIYQRPSLLQKFTHDRDFLNSLSVLLILNRDGRTLIREVGLQRALRLSISSLNTFLFFSQLCPNFYLFHNV